MFKESIYLMWCWPAVPTNVQTYSYEMNDTKNWRMARGSAYYNSGGRELLEKSYSRSIGCCVICCCSGSFLEISWKLFRKARRRHIQRIILPDISWRGHSSRAVYGVKTLSENFQVQPTGVPCSHPVWSQNLKQNFLLLISKYRWRRQCSRHEDKSGGTPRSRTHLRWRV